MADLLGFDDAADRIGVPSAELRRRYKEWGLTPHKRGSRIGFDQAELDEWREKTNAQRESAYQNRTR